MTLSSSSVVTVFRTNWQLAGCTSELPREQRSMLFAATCQIIEARLLQSSDRLAHCHTVKYLLSYNIVLNCFEYAV